MLPPNTILQNRYLIIRSIGQGGMGTVYLAKDQRLGNTVALKETSFLDVRMRKAFEREARLLAHLHHPVLPKVMDHFDESDGQFLVMEFIPGDDLEVLLAERGQGFPQDQVLSWADQLLDALEYLHSQETPILHRDIKPANLKRTNGDRIILLDFGLAKGTAGQMTSVATNKSVFGFTPNFAPLEQIQGTGTDPRSDLYSLGATLYCLLTGIIPPNALSRATASIGDKTDPLLPADQADSEVTPAVAFVLNRAMALNPAHRPANAAAMRKTLREANQSRSEASKDKLEAISGSQERQKAETVVDVPPTIQSAETTENLQTLHPSISSDDSTVETEPDVTYPTSGPPLDQRSGSSLLSWIGIGVLALLASSLALALSVPRVIHTPSTAELARIVLRWSHFVAGTVWIGLLYFFNLVNVPLQQELDSNTKRKVNPFLLARALWYFRWGALVTVVVGFIYFAVYILATDVNLANRLGDGSINSPRLLLVWLSVPLVTFSIEFLTIKNIPALTRDGRTFAVIAVILVVVMCIVVIKWLDSGLTVGQESFASNKTLSIGVGGALGIVMMLNVWGIIWPNNKRMIGAMQGGPPAAPELARQAFVASRTNAWLSLPLLLFMGTSHGDWLIFAGK